MPIFLWFIRVFSPGAEIPGVVRRLGWVSLLTDAATEMIYPLLPAFLLSMGGSVTDLGIMEGVAESIGALVKWWAGRASDRYRSRKRFVIVGYGLATIARSILAFATAPWHVTILRSTDRVGKGLRSAPRDAMIAQAVPNARRGMAFGFHRMMDNLGATLGPLLAFALGSLAKWPLRYIFLFAIVPAAASFVTLVVGVHEAPSAGDIHTDGASSGRLSHGIYGYLAIVALFTLGASADSFLLLRMMDLGLKVAWVPLAWLSLSASKALTNLWGGRLSDRFGRVRTLAVGWFVYAFAYALFPLFQSLLATWLLLVVYGSYYGIAEGGERAIVGDLSDSHVKGRAFGAYHAVTGFAILPANLLFGFLYAKHPAFAFEVSAGCAFLAALALLGRFRSLPGR